MPGQCRDARGSADVATTAGRATDQLSADPAVPLPVCPGMRCAGHPLPDWHAATSGKSDASNTIVTTATTGVASSLQPSVRMLALTLPLGLSRDDAASPAVCSSAIRVLGVYCTFPFLREVSQPAAGAPPPPPPLTHSPACRTRPSSRTVGQPSFMLWPAAASQCGYKPPGPWETSQMPSSPLPTWPAEAGVSHHTLSC